VGAFIVQGVSEAATVYGGGSQTRVLIFGLALVAVVLFMPAGLLPTLEAFGASATRPTSSTPTRRERSPPVRSRRFDHDQRRALATWDRRPPTNWPTATPARTARRLQAVRRAWSRSTTPSLTVRKGSITALIGPNGSGKTTLVQPGHRRDGGRRGRDLVRGPAIEKLPPWQRGHLGLGRTFQVTRLFKEMTVQQNVVAPLPDSALADDVRGRRQRHEAARARELLDIVGLGRFAGERAGSLSYGQQKLVELAQVLMLEPQLILLDEPAGGVNPSLLGRLTEVIRELNQRGSPSWW
jgi:branched-chain amino acid transport system permease protein